MSYEKYMLTREAENTILDLPYEEGEEKIEITIRPLSWSKKKCRCLPMYQLYRRWRSKV